MNEYSAENFQIYNTDVDPFIIIASVDASRKRIPLQVNVMDRIAMEIHERT